MQFKDLQLSNHRSRITESYALFIINEVKCGKVCAKKKKKNFLFRQASYVGGISLQFV